MTRHRHRIAGILAAIFASACGGGTSAPSSPTPPTDTTTATPAPVGECRLPARFSGTGLGFPRVSNRLPSTGDVRVTVIYVDFADAVAARTPQSVQSILSPTAENYFRAVSYGRMNLVFEPNLQWRRMSRPTTAYGWSALTFALHKTYIQEAIDLAASSVDFSRTDGILVMSNPDAGALTNGPAFVPNPGNGVTANGRSIESAATSGRDLLGWGGYWMNHEFGHTLGLPDLYAASGSGHRFVGGFSLMGLISGPAREFMAWERWLLNWVTDDQVVCANRTGSLTATLSPIERSGGTKMIVAPVGATSAVVVESRRVEGFDGGFTQGALVYFVDTSIGSAQGPIRVLPINDADNSKLAAPLMPGQSVSYQGIAVTNVSSDASGDRISIIR